MFSHANFISYWSMEKISANAYKIIFGLIYDDNLYLFDCSIFQLILIFSEWIYRRNKHTHSHINTYFILDTLRVWERLQEYVVNVARCDELCIQRWREARVVCAHLSAPNEPESLCCDEVRVQLLAVVSESYVAIA